MGMVEGSPDFAFAGTRRTVNENGVAHGKQLIQLYNLKRNNNGNNIIY